ncbi:MAG TPA: hypothetical protein VIJ51_15940 [Solirubrobacteraceae bacterium]
MTVRPNQSDPRVPARRRRRVARIAACCGLTVLVAAGCGGSAGGKTETLKLENQLTTETNLPISPTTSLGAQLVFTGMIYEPAGTAAIGRDQTACTRTAPGNGQVFECVMTFIMPSGQIYAEAASSHSGPGTGVVTGGTGNYAGMRGTFLFTATGNPRVDLTFSLRS